MKAYKILSVVVLASLILSLGVGCGQAPAKGTIKIYASWPMQGAMIPEGTAMLNAAKMALDEVKSTAGGYTLELVFLDDASPTTGSWDGDRKSVV